MAQQWQPQGHVCKRETAQWKKPRKVNIYKNEEKTIKL
jgi:hypothetical protein